MITRVVGQHETIVVRAGVSGPTYSLESGSGKILISDMTLEQLALKDREMFDEIKTMQANVLWAGE